ncbi:MAG: hypothetical protein ACTS44_00675 [Candidatus Hodgkinia cicadicola]
MSFDLLSEVPSAEASLPRPHSFIILLECGSRLTLSSKVNSSVQVNFRVYYLSR